MAAATGVVNRLREQFLAGAALAGDEYRRFSLGRTQGNHLEPLNLFAGTDNTVDRILAALHFLQLFLVILQLGLQGCQLSGQHPQILDIPEHHLADGAGHFPIFENGNPGHHRVMLADFLHVADLRLAGLRHDMHAGIFNDIGDMPTDRLLWIRMQKFSVSVIHHRHIAVFVDHHNAVENTVDDRIKSTFKVLDFFKFGRHLLQFGNVLKNGDGADNFVVFDDG